MSPKGHADTIIKVVLKSGDDIPDEMLTAHVLSIKDYGDELAIWYVRNGHIKRVK